MEDLLLWLLLKLLETWKPLVAANVMQLCKQKQTKKKNQNAYPDHPN